MQKISSSEQPLFCVATTAGVANSPVLLSRGTWEHHVRTGHPEVYERFIDVKLAVSDPCYVAKSRASDNKYTKNYVFVCTTSKIGSSKLHVFVEDKDSFWFVSSAMFCRRDYHGEVVWRKDDSAAVGSDYDVNTDVLYIYLGKPVPAVGEVDEDGLLLRFATEDDRPCGVTVISYNKDWGSERGRLARSVADFLKVDDREALQALPSI
jgi:hypothetical protein